MFLKYYRIFRNKDIVKFALTICCCLFGFVTPVTADLILEENFQLGYLDKYPENSTGLVAHACEVGLNGVSVQPNISRDGNYALRSYLEKNNELCPNNPGPDKKGVRAEIATFKKPITYGQTYWLGFSIYISSDWVIENNEWGSDYVMQLKSRSSERDAILSLRISQSNWKLVTSYENNNTYTNWTGPKSSMLDNKGKWTDFVFKVKPSLTRGNASLTVWENSVKVFSKTNMSIGYPGDEDMYFKFGLYKPTMRTKYTNITSHTAYYDQIRIGNANSNLEEVSPRGTSSIVNKALPNKPFAPALLVQRLPKP